MNAKKKLFNNVKDYATKVMKCQDFVDYMTVVVENYFSSHQKARTETLSFSNEPKTLQEAYAVLNATILTMEDSLAGCFNEFTGGITMEIFDSVMATIGEYLSLPNVRLFIFQNSKDFADMATTDKERPSGNELSNTTSKEFFNSTTYENIMYFLKKIAYVSAKKVYGYIENHDAYSGEIPN